MQHAIVSTVMVSDSVKSDNVTHNEQLNVQLRNHLDSFKWSEEACEGILQLIDQGASPNVHSLDDVYRRFPLTMIACYGTVNQLQRLLRYPTLDLNVVNCKGHTALHKVVVGNMDEVMRIAKLEALLAPMPHNQCGPIQVNAVGVSGTPLYASTVLLPDRIKCTEDVDGAQNAWIQVSTRLLRAGADDTITELRPDIYSSPHLVATSIANDSSCCDLCTAASTASAAGEAATDTDPVETQDHLIHQLQHWCPPVPHALAHYMAAATKVIHVCTQ